MKKNDGKELRLYQQENENLKAIFHNLKEGICILSKDKKVTFFNKIAEKITQISAKNILNKDLFTFLNIYSLNYNKIDNSIVECVLKNKSFSKQKSVFYIKKTNKKFPILISAIPIKNSSKNNGCIVVFEDISLEKEIDKIKTEFVSITSHQLRTPLSSVKWTLELFLEENKKILSKRQIELLNRTKESDENMIKLVNDILNVSRIEYGKIMPQIEKTELVELARKSLDEILIQIKNKKQQLITQGFNKKCYIYTDAELLKQILQNLLSNASKYTDENGLITISISIQEKNILIIISDNGYGIPKNEYDRVFQKFFRADNAIVKETEGTGLGLYLVKSFVNLLKGQIWFKSKINKGSSFYIKLPFKI